MKRCRRIRKALFVRSGFLGALPQVCMHYVHNNLLCAPTLSFRREPAQSLNTPMFVDRACGPLAEPMVPLDDCQAIIFQKVFSLVLIYEYYIHSMLKLQ